VIGAEVPVEWRAGLDVGKADLKACMRVPGPRSCRRQQVKVFATTTGALLLRHWPIEQDRGGGDRDDQRSLEAGGH
jgi:hypothetical protein